MDVKLPFFSFIGTREQRQLADLPGASPEPPFALRLEIGPKAEVPRLKFYAQDPQATLRQNRLLAS